MAKNVLFLKQFLPWGCHTPSSHCSHGPGCSIATTFLVVKKSMSNNGGRGGASLCKWECEVMMGSGHALQKSGVGSSLNTPVAPPLNSGINKFVQLVYNVILKAKTKVKYTLYVFGECLRICYCKYGALFRQDKFVTRKPLLGLQTSYHPLQNRSPYSGAHVCKLSPGFEYRNHCFKYTHIGLIDR